MTPTNDPRWSTPYYGVCHARGPRGNQLTIEAHDLWEKQTADPNAYALATATLTVYPAQGDFPEAFWSNAQTFDFPSVIEAKLWVQEHFGFVGGNVPVPDQYKPSKDVAA